MHSLVGAKQSRCLSNARFGFSLLGYAINPGSSNLSFETLLLRRFTAFPGCSVNSKGISDLSRNITSVGGLWRYLGNFRMGLGLMNTKGNVASFMNSPNPKDNQTGRPSRSMDFVRGIIEENGKDMGGSRYSVEQNADFVHIKLIRNNTFVTVTDNKGNKKIGASSGCLPEMKGGPKLSRYAAEATAEHVGRMARNLGLKSVVMKVKGFTYFKKKRQAIMSWREGYTYSRGDLNPIVYIEDTTRKAHNGCRLPKKRRV